VISVIWFKHILFLQMYTQHIQVQIQLDWVESLVLIETLSKQKKMHRNKLVVVRLYIMYIQIWQLLT